MAIMEGRTGTTHLTGRAARKGQIVTRTAAIRTDRARRKEAEAKIKLPAMTRAREEIGIVTVATIGIRTEIEAGAETEIGTATAD
jgi:hypothetical protein